MITSSIKQSFISIVGEAFYYDSPAERLVYSYDATPNYQAMPDAILSPSSAEEIASIVKVCGEHGIPIVPRGSGTNLCPAPAPQRAGSSFSLPV